MTGIEQRDVSFFCIFFIIWNVEFKSQVANPAINNDQHESLGMEIRYSHIHQLYKKTLNTGRSPGFLRG